MLSTTVLASGHTVRLGKADSDGSRVLGGRRGLPTQPVLLNDGRWLRVSVGLYLEPQDEGGSRLKVSQSSFQYQADEEGNQEICRYDYLRQAQSKNVHPQAHLNVHGQLTHDPAGAGTPLDRIHFPTGRMALEAVLRLLIEEFEVPTNRGSSVWRPLLSCSEEEFRKIAHQPPSGPSA